jgi:hypothetical protein
LQYDPGNKQLKAPYLGRSAGVINESTVDKRKRHGVNYFRAGVNDNFSQIIIIVIVHISFVIHPRALYSATGTISDIFLKTDMLVYKKLMDLKHLSSMGIMAFE